MPIVGACRADVPMDSNTLRRVPEKHGNLHRNPAALDEMEGILTTSIIIIKAAKPVAQRVDAPDLALAGQAITIHVTPAEPTRHAIHLTVTSKTSTLVEARQIRPSGGPVTIDGLSPGAHSIDLAGADPASPFAPVSSDIFIWETRRRSSARSDNTAQAMNRVKRSLNHGSNPPWLRAFPAGPARKGET